MSEGKCQFLYLGAALGAQFCYVHQHQSKVSIVFTSLAESTTNGSFLDVNWRGNNSVNGKVLMIVLMSGSTWRIMQQQGKG